MPTRSDPTASAGTPADPPARRWDPVVKLTHWSVVAAVIANALITEEGSPPHIWVGYTLAAVLALRLIWGLIGPVEARFTSFPPSPARALDHIRDIAAGRAADHPSHNPLGALMVYAIWATLGVIIATGIAMAGIPAAAGSGVESPRNAPVAAGHREEEEERGYEEETEDDEDEGKGEEREHEEGPLTEAHEVAVNLLYALILLHLAGVIFETRRSGRHIAMAMLPGRR